MQEITLTRPLDELSCIIGTLFTDLEPPCDVERTADLVLCGTTHSGNPGRLRIAGDRCIFYVEPDDLEAVLSGRCPERRCCHG